MAVVLGVALTVVLAGVVAAQVPLRREVACFVQPASVAYPDGRDPHVAVVFAERSLLAATFGAGGRLTVVLGPDPSGAYGQPVALDTPGDGRTELAEVRWEPTGARLVYRSGHDVLVPARMFLGGR